MPRRLAAALCALALGATRAAAAPDATATAPTAPTAPVTSAAATDPAAMVDEVIAEVARLRGLARLRPIARAVVGPDDLASVADASAARVADDALGFAAARWGLLGQADAYGAVRGAVLRAQLVGFYDRVAKRLYVGADDGDPLARRLLLAHEIDHALVDQHFGLGKLLDAKGLDGDAALARQALVEGDAMAVMAEVVLAQVGAPAPWTDPEAAATLDHTLATGGPASAALGSAPPWLRDRMLFPYRAGLAFVAGIR
ncbi:MAG: hypothetical protein K8W52_16530, partial [Deltaproteobacteria bacterium]|nr:hypothetical protein [Deltaproteobacteria bacterium]